MGSPTAHMKRNAARYCESSRIAKTTSTALATGRAPPSLTGACQAATLAGGVKPHLSDTALVALDAKLHDDIDEQVQQALDVMTSQLGASSTLFDQQNELLECELGTRRM